ncbi:MAG: thiamine phosphate synthase [Firmicutes bacterium]|nr:thiamine phosphate synthase [Bacillota bacterium]
MDFTLHVLVDPAQVALDEVGAFCEALAAGGATIVQLRGKRASGRELVTFGLILRRETRRTGLGLIVNDRVDIALAIEADGVHVGQEDIPVPLVRRLAPQLVIGLSVGSREELAVARAHRPDYIGMGPVYPTASKADAGPALGVEAFKALRAEAADVAPVVAIGGIGPENVDAVWQAGADGIAVISAVMGADDKREACRRLVEHHRAI